MALINKEGYYNLVTYEGNVKLEYLTDTLVWLMREEMPNEYDYYYLEFKLSDSFDVFPIKTFIPNDIIERIKKREIYLMIANFHESFLSVVEGIYKSLVIRDEIPAEQIVLGSGNYDIYEEVKRVSKLTGHPEIRVEWYLELEYTQQCRKLVMMDIVEGAPPCQPSTLNTLQIKDYPKKYLNFNRRWRIHRPMMVSLLKAYDLLDKGYVSLGKSDDGNSWDTVWWDIKQESKIFCPEMYQTLIEKEIGRAHV